MPAATRQCSTPPPANAGADAGCPGAFWSGRFALVADTRSCADGPLGAPPGCADGASYRAAIRARWAAGPAARQQLACLAWRLEAGRHHGALGFLGPFADEARAILTAIRDRRRAP
ncbi:hypothetical protein [Thiococcus pfennigii]|uniref:hypothetical protein n=1 Tax=Thiococcus pfennigii TaxID=1057 RepID=UPI0019038B7B|nr:hypothetical protein [Thiococcus pfennigii]MBK1732772.1 hypothetical protein [Thiococcus pfennigii]